MNIEAGQVRESGGIQYAVIGRDIYDPGHWITQWLNEGGLQSFKEKGIEQDKLITNADGTPAEPPEPEQPRDCCPHCWRYPKGKRYAGDHRVLTTITNGIMELPCRDGSLAKQNCTATGGIVHDGFGCNSFRFEEDPQAEYLYTKGWVIPCTRPTIVQPAKCHVYSQEVRARYAIWRRLG